MFKEIFSHEKLKFIVFFEFFEILLWLLAILMLALDLQYIYRYKWYYTDKVHFVYICVIRLAHVSHWTIPTSRAMLFQSRGCFVWVWSFIMILIVWRRVIVMPED